MSQKDRESSISGAPTRSGTMRVVVVPGNAFGERGRGHIRACYASSMEQIAEACDRIQAFVKRVS